MNPVFTPYERTMESLWPPTGQWPRRWPTDFRKFMFWIFAATAVSFTPLILYKVLRPHPVSLLQNLLNGPIFVFLMAAISGVAAWSVWNGKTWARAWAIAASLLYVLVFVRQFVIPLRTARDHSLIALVAGVLGLVSYLWPDSPGNSAGAVNTN